MTGFDHYIPRATSVGGCQAVSLLLSLSILLATIQHGDAERKIVCYYTNWSIYRPGTAKFSPQNINPYLCTHLIYAFGGFTKDNALKPFDKYQDIEKGGYAKFTGLKTYNKNLKTLLAIGGWNEGSSRFSPMVADSDRRREFVKNSVKFLRKNHFDGLDLDWEYPAFRDGGKPRDKDNYASLVQELREEFEKESSKTGRPRLLLSLAMPAGIEYIDKGYDVPRLNEYLDFINLLSYDYHSSYEPAVNHHSPLYPLEEDNEYNYDSELTIDYTINYLMKKGASPDKIILGIPTYGRSYTLFNQDATELGSPADGPGIEGDATREKGYLAYYEICESLSQSDDWEVIQPNPKAMGPYAYKEDQWVGYDDEDIVKLKAKYANEKSLGGIMFWTIDNDDFRGKCHDRPYPLIEAAKETLLTDSGNSVQKTKTADSRKKTRTPTVQSNVVGRKHGARRSTTTAAPITRKRASSPRPKFRTFTRSKASREEDDDDREVERRSYSPSSEEDEDSDGGNTVKIIEKSDRSREKGKSRPKNRSSSNRNRRKQTRRKENRNDSQEEPLSNKLTTPEPPTTPDPGSDFKCEDEGFFSHPRDCKKYFWCLDSGPGGLGVVAHQFTCPSGLVFNKAADSCDYPRNVVCPKAKTSQTASTTRAPITAATSRTTYLYSSTRRPTTEKPEEDEEEYDEEYEDEDELEEEEEVEEKKEQRPRTTPKPLLYKTITRNRPTTTTTTTTTTEQPSTTKRSESHEETVKLLGTDDEEDPRVIKELIQLIKKAGGIEELEKQLFHQEKSTDESSTSKEHATPATISRTLYERVLNRQSGKTTSRTRTSGTSSYANGPGGAQFEGLDELPEVKSLRRAQKPQYVTIERPKPSRKEPVIEEDEAEEDDDDLEEDIADVASSEEQTVSNPFLTSSTQRATPNYFNIRRSRPSTTTSRNENDVEIKDEDEEDEAPVRSRRPSTYSRSTESSLEDTKEDSEDSAPTTKSRYVSIQRFRSTTARSTEPVSQTTSTSPEPTTEPTSKAAEVEEKETTTPATTASPSTISSSTTTTFTTPNSIQISDAEKPASSAEVTSSTTEAVRLVEDSATEILLTTAPASQSSTLSAPSTRAVSATVSQPRPFRRNRPTTEASTTPLPGSKVSIAPRNTARSFLAGRGRLRPRQETSPGPDGENAARATAEGAVGPAGPGRSRQRGTSSAAESAPEPPRRRFRRPISRAVTEGPKGNELEDSPIVRITQGGPRRTSSRARSAAKDDENDKITNIKVFKKPAANRDIYARTRYTRKRNNEESSSKQEEVQSLNHSPTTVAISTTLDGSESDALKESTTEEFRSTSVESYETTALGLEDATDSFVETNTIESVPTESIVENEVVTDQPSTTELPQATTVGSNKIEDFDPDIIKIVFPGNSTNFLVQEVGAANATVPRRRKVLLRKRPVTSTTSAQEDEEEPAPRRRKVIKRLRVQNATEVPPTEDDRIILRFASTTAKEEEAPSLPTVDGITGIDVSTESLSASTTETAGTVDYIVINDFTAAGFETPGSTIDEYFENSDAATMASTLVDNFTATQSGETTDASTEPTTPFLIKFADTENTLEETSTSQSETVATSTSAPTSRRLEPYNRTYYLDSRFVRKKFVRRRPVESSDNAGQVAPSNTLVRVSSTTEISNLEGASKRRKSLFIRRRPVTSTTSRTTGFVEESNENLNLEEEEASSETTPRTSRDSVFEISLPTSSDSREFWSQYTTPSTDHPSSLVPQEAGESLPTGSEEVYQSTSRPNRRPDSRPRYRVPDSLRKVSTEGAYAADSSPEESEDSNESKPRYQSFRQPRTRVRYEEGTREEQEEALDATQSPSFDSSTHVRTRFYARRPATSTESAVTETLIPAKRFDYVADAHRRQQSLRTTPRSANEEPKRSEDSTSPSPSEDRADQNLVELEYATTPSSQPLVTRLVTSVEESATTERQKILIKTKYSSLTSTTRIPVQTTPSSVADAPKDSSEDESANEIRQGMVERSTLPIEGEFLHRAGRVTTESHESSTIEIESVFSNLIAGREAGQ
nr:mucin-5AC-like [Nomia melanderi]